MLYFWSSGEIVKSFTISQYKAESCTMNTEVQRMCDLLVGALNFELMWRKSNVYPSGRFLLRGSHMSVLCLHSAWVGLNLMTRMQWKLWLASWRRLKCYLLWSEDNPYSMILKFQLALGLMIIAVIWPCLIYLYAYDTPVPDFTLVKFNDLYLKPNSRMWMLSITEDIAQKREEQCSI